MLKLKPQMVSKKEELEFFIKDSTSDSHTRYISQFLVYLCSNSFKSTYILLIIISLISYGTFIGVSSLVNKKSNLKNEHDSSFTLMKSQIEKSLSDKSFQTSFQNLTSSIDKDFNSYIKNANALKVTISPNSLASTYQEQMTLVGTFQSKLITIATSSQDSSLSSFYSSPSQFKKDWTLFQNILHNNYNTSNFIYSPTFEILRETNISFNFSLANIDKNTITP